MPAQAKSGRPPYEVILKEHKEYMKEVEKLRKENADLFDKLTNARNSHSRLEKDLETFKDRATRSGAELEMLKNAAVESGPGLEVYRDMCAKMVRFVHWKVRSCSCKHKANVTRCERFSCIHLLSVVKPLEDRLVDDGKVKPFVLWRPKKLSPGRAQAGPAEGMPGRVGCGMDWETAAILPEITDGKPRPHRGGHAG